MLLRDCVVVGKSLLLSGPWLSLYKMGTVSAYVLYRMMDWVR